MAPARKEHDKPTIKPPSAASHGGASSRRGKPESSRGGPSPSKGQKSPRGPSKRSTQKDQTRAAAGEAAGEATAQDVAEAAEIDELKELFGTSSRNAQIGEAVLTTANAPKAEQQVAELESVPEDPPPAQDEAEQAKAVTKPEEAKGAAQSLNADASLALTSLDDRLVDVLSKGHIRLVRSAWLLAQPEDYRIEKRQDLELLEQSGVSPSPLLTFEEAVALIRKGNRSAGVLSYGCARQTPASGRALAAALRLPSATSCTV